MCELPRARKGTVPDSSICPSQQTGWPSIDDGVLYLSNTTVEVGKVVLFRMTDASIVVTATFECPYLVWSRTDANSSSDSSNNVAFTYQVRLARTEGHKGTGERMHVVQSCKPVWVCLECTSVKRAGPVMCGLCSPSHSPQDDR